MKKILLILFLFIGTTIQAQILHKVQVDSLYGYANAQNDIVIPCRYGLAYTDTLRTLGFVFDQTEKRIKCFNNQGKFLFYTFYYDNGPDYVESGYFRIEDQEGRIGFANEEGRVVIPPVFRFATSFYGDKARVTFRGKKVWKNAEFWQWESDEWFYLSKPEDQ